MQQQTEKTSKLTRSNVRIQFSIITDRPTLFRQLFLRVPSTDENLEHSPHHEFPNPIHHQGKAICMIVRLMVDLHTRMIEKGNDLILTPAGKWDN